MIDERGRRGRAAPQPTKTRSHPAHATGSQHQRALQRKRRRRQQPPRPQVRAPDRGQARPSVSRCAAAPRSPTRDEGAPRHQAPALRWRRQLPQRLHRQRPHSLTPSHVRRVTAQAGHRAAGAGAYAAQDAACVRHDPRARQLLIGERAGVQRCGAHRPEQWRLPAEAVAVHQSGQAWMRWLDARQDPAEQAIRGRARR